MLLAFTFFMGIMLSRLVGSVLGHANGASLVMYGLRGYRRGVSLGIGVAFLGDQARPPSAMGKWLFIGAILLLVAGIANFFIQSSALMITSSVLAVGSSRPSSCTISSACRTATKPTTSARRWAST